MRTSTARRSLVAATLLAVLAPVGIAATTAPAAAAVRKPVARNDKVTMAYGTSTDVRVLANDTIAKKRRAKIRLVSVPPGVGARTTPKRVIHITAINAGVHKVKYRVIDRRGRRDTAVIRVTVKQRVLIPPSVPATPPPSTPPPSGDPTPTTPPPTTNPPTSNPTLHALVQALPVATEHRDGYDRDLFKHWVDADRDGCDTRREVLIVEAVVAPTIGSGCSFTGGSWSSYYDGVTTTDASTFDIDHMVPLAEAWDSGAWNWTAARREMYANDLGDPRTLVAVSASSNRSKSDRDPAEWLPARDRCRYVAEWTVVKHRWDLTVDTIEKDALWAIASACPDATVTFAKAS